MVTNVIKVIGSRIAPNPIEVDYWVDTRTNPYGADIKYHNGIDWVNLFKSGNSEIDLSNYYTKRQVDSKLIVKADTSAVNDLFSTLNNTKADKTSTYTKSEINTLFLNFDPFDESKYYTKVEIDTKGYLTDIPAVYITEDELSAFTYDKETIDSTLATKTYVTDEIAKAALGGEVDLTGYATEQWVEGKGYLTEHQDISHLASKDYVDKGIADLVDGAPETLNTLNEISEALKENEDVVSALDKAIGSKADKTSLEGLATEEFVKEQINAIEHPTVDLTGYATEEWVEAEIAKIEPGSNVDVSTLATKTELANVEAKIPTNLSTVATSGSYDDLLDTPEIPTELLPDEEDITTYSESGSNILQFKNRDTSNGKGYVIVRKDKDIIDQFNQSNTIYEIRYDFDLDGQPLTIPDNCVLKFEGGSLSNGSIDGVFEVRTASNGILFNNIDSGFSITNHIVESEWFGEISQSVDSSIAINKSLSAAASTSVVRFPRRSFTVANSIIINKTKTIDGRNYKHRIGTNVIIPTANISVFVIGDGFLDGTLKNISIQPDSSSSQVRNYVGIEMTGCESFVVENIKIQYADIAYKLVTETQISVPTFKNISAHDCNTGMRIEGVDSGWPNGIDVKPYWFTNNYVHFHILGGQVTTIRGGSVEIGNSGTKPSWFGSSPRGIIAENDSVVNIFGCIWGENVNGSSSGYYIEASGFAKINIYGDAWISDKTLISDYAQVKYFGSAPYPKLDYARHSSGIKQQAVQYISANNASFNKSDYFCYSIDPFGNTDTANRKLQIVKLPDGRPGIQQIIKTSSSNSDSLTNYTIILKFVTKAYTHKINLLLDGTWSNTIHIQESQSTGHLSMVSGSSSKNVFFYNIKTIRNVGDYKECICIASFDHDNSRVITMDHDYNFYGTDVSFLDNITIDPYNFALTVQNDSGTNNSVVTDFILLNQVLSADDFIWWMDYMKNGGADSIKIGTTRPDTAEIGHTFFDIIDGTQYVKTAETYGTTLQSVTWKETNPSTATS